jgi:glycosyltransferase involved in cell wall biosynthesis
MEVLLHRLMRVVQKSNAQYLLSVIIPISRMAGRLQNLEITLSNLHKEKEIQIILIHDIQDSNTGVEIGKILDLYPKNSVKLIEKYFGSPGSARNFGINYVKGSWVNFVDSDDIFMPSDLIQILRGEETLSSAALVSNYETVDSVTKLVTVHVHNESLTKIALRPGLWRWTFNASLIGHTRFSNLSMGEDQKFLYDFYKVNQKINLIDVTTYRYTINQELQLTNQSKPKRDLFQVLSEILEIRKSTQANFDEFTETMILKLFISSIIHSTMSKKVRSVFKFIPVMIPTSKVRLRYKKLRLRDWLKT